MTNGVATSDANNVTPCPPTLHALPRTTLEVNPVLLKASISEDYLTLSFSSRQVRVRLSYTKLVGFPVNEYTLVCIMARMRETEAERLLDFVETTVFVQQL